VVVVVLGVLVAADNDDHKSLMNDGKDGSGTGWRKAPFATSRKRYCRKKKEEKEEKEEEKEMQDQSASL